MGFIFISKNRKFKKDKNVVLSNPTNLKYPSDPLPVYIEVN